MIDVRELHFSYAHSDKVAVRGLAFAVERGEIFGFLGPSGAGKSTTQKVLIGLLEGYSGSVRVRGREVAAWTADDYERIGVSFEAPNHFLKLTGLENLRYFAALYHEPTRVPAALLESVGLQSDANRRVGEYSKGMKCRLSIARCLLNTPDLIFLDEPTGGLDPVNMQRVKDIIRAERDGGATVFLTTHDMAAADELCDRVAFIVDGRIACIDSPRALKLQHGERAVRIEYRSGDRTVHADFPLDGLADNPAFQQVLRECDVHTIHTREAALAEVFIRVTGQALT
ncbi:MAG TPA: ABC transporter ATP-binding protein [Vicinamibacterales bacterium]|nr:ABC transporter ATP-binding protein [Vicinamibacterales bacterium]